MPGLCLENGKTKFDLFRYGNEGLGEEKGRVSNYEEERISGRSLATLCSEKGGIRKEENNSEVMQDEEKNLQKNSGAAKDENLIKKVS